MGAFIINLSTHSFLIPLMGYISELTSFCPRLLCWWLANWAYFSQCLLWLLWWDIPPLHASSPGIACVPLYWFVWKMKTLLFFFFWQLRFLLNMLLKRFSQKDQSPCHHQILQILLSLLLCPPQLGQQWWMGARPPAGAAPAAMAGPPAPTLQMRLPMLTLAKAFANKPGQKGSTFTLAAFNEGIDFILRDHAEWGQSRCKWALRLRPWWGRMLGGGCQAQC